MRERYFLFTYDTYYPSGGLSDLTGRFDNLSEIKKLLENLYKTNVFTRTRKTTSKGKKFTVVDEFCQVSGPDTWEVLDLDTGDDVSHLVGFETPKGYKREISRVAI